MSHTSDVLLTSSEEDGNRWNKLSFATCNRSARGDRDSFAVAEMNQRGWSRYNVQAGTLGEEADELRQLFLAGDAGCAQVKRDGGILFLLRAPFLSFPSNQLVEDQ